MFAAKASVLNKYRESFSEHFVYESYDEESGLFFNRGSVGFVLIGEPLPGAEITAQNEISDFISDSDNLPDGASLQVINVGTKDIDFLLDRWMEQRKGEIFQAMAKRRVEFLKDQAERGVIKDCFLLISLTVPDRNTDILTMERRRDALKSCLSSINLRTQDVNEVVLVSILEKLWGEQSGLPVDINPHTPLSQQILPVDFSLEEQEDKVLINDDEAFVCLEAKDKRRPSNWNLPSMDLFIGDESKRNEYIAADYIIHTGVVVEQNQLAEKASLVARRETVQKNIRSGFAKWMPDLYSEDEDLAAATALSQKQDRVVRIHTNVVLKGGRDKVINASKNYASMMRRKGWGFAPVKYDHVAVMLACMPMSLVEEGKQSIFGRRTVSGIGNTLAWMNRGTKTMSSESRVLLPIVGEYKGNLNAPGLLLSGRRGQLKYFSQYGSELTKNLSSSTEQLENYNISIAGISGSGKSVLMQDIMLATLGVGGKVFVLDYGKSFRDLCLELGGQYIEFNPTNPISINPFSTLPTGDDKLSVEARADFLASFPITLATMAAPKLGTNDLQDKLLAEALRAVYERKGNFTEIDDIAEYLAAKDDNVSKDLSKMLFSYTSRGSYGEFFRGKAQVTLDADIVVIETDHLRNYKDLMAVVMQIMFIHINSNMAKGSTDFPKLLTFEEIAKTLDNKLAMKFVDSSLRIVRKYNTSVMLATQLLTDFEKLGKDAASIFEGSSFKIIMKQSSDSISKMESMPLLKSYVDGLYRQQRMRGVESQKGEFSEFSLWGPGINGDICRLRIDPFSLLLMSTNPHEKELKRRYMEEGLSRAAAINRIIEERRVAG